jgi:hypothetical protein
MKTLLVVFTALIAVASANAQQAEITGENWQARPAINRIRQLYEDIEDAAKSGAYVEREERDACRGEVFVGRFFEDSAGVVRKYVMHRTTQYGSLAEARYYYDAAGVLRFVLQSVRSSRAHKEFRFYFDESGGRLYTDERLLEGRDVAIPFEVQLEDPGEALAAMCPPPDLGIDVRIVDIQARLFCEETGELTRDVIGERGAALINTPAGFGDAGCASSATLVLVAVEGPAYEYFRPEVRVSLLAEADSSDVRDVPLDTVALQSVALGWFGPDGLSFVPVLLYDTGCETIHLTAWLEGARDATERRERISFVCGE